MKRNLKWSAQLCVVGLCALALKAHYSLASPDELRWILAPTTWLVEVLSGRSFSFESHAGYMSSDHSFLIAASCAGVNFMIASFLMLSLRGLLAGNDHSTSWRFVPVMVSVAYVSTLIANTVRICIALEMQKANFRPESLDANQLHRLEGIVVYFAFLLMLFLLTEKTNTGSLVARLKRLCFPVAIYYATTLLLPLLNVQYRKTAAFWEHSLFVLVVPILVSVLMLMVYLVSDLTRRGSSSVKEGSRRVDAENRMSPP
jgi:exosortase K